MKDESMSTLYHRKVCWPTAIQQLVQDVVNQADFHRCEYGFHAKLAAKDDRYGQFTLPLFIQVNESCVFEAEVDNARLVKLAVRIPLDEHRDISLVLVPKGRDRFFVKTAWINLKSDRHRTLQRNRYAVH